MTVLMAFNYAGVFVFAITGALVAARKNMDVFGFVVLALMPAVGGGTIRDLILDVPVFWISNTTYLFITLVAALITFAAVHFMERLKEIIIWLDAIGLSVFCVTGTAKSLSVIADPVIAVVMGVITAVAGGIMRDVIANESPLILHKEVYATAAFAGSLVFVLIRLFVPFLPSQIALVVAMLVAFIVRGLGIKFGISLPASGFGSGS